MAQTAESIPVDPDPPSSPALAMLAGKSVCPFCGAITDKADEACRRCTMENTPLTRQATRARIGPWHVMQARNPSAPGMKLNTLLNLIRKGQITPRSVMRGPTTHQLWRFAARVKGVSRHFGLCYSCGAAINATAGSCPKCSRSQDLPANPDALLEVETPIPTATYRQTKSPVGENVKAAAIAEQKTTPQAKVSSPAGAKPVAISGNGIGAKPVVDKLKLTPEPESNDTNDDGSPRQWPAERILSARDLAAAFSLQFDTQNDQPMNQSMPRPKGGTGRLVLVALLIMVGIGAAAVWFVPRLHDPTVAWIQQTYQSIRGNTVTSNDSPVAPTDDSKPIASPPGQDTNASSTASTPPAAAEPNWAMKPPTISAPVVSTPSKPGDASAMVTSTPEVKTVTDNSPPPDSNKTDASADANPTVKPAATINPQDKAASLDQLGMELRSNGMDAEAKQDFKGAAYFYQQIEKTLPKENWPSDTDQLLTAANRIVAASAKPQN
jgi:ribosomal protein L40E